MRDSSHPTRSYEFARRMASQGHEVIMVTGSSRLPEPYRDRLVSRFDVEGIHVLSARNTYSNYMNYTSRILSFARFMIVATWLAVTAPRPDVVFATSTPLTVAVPGYLASRLRRRPYVFEVRDPWPDAVFQMGALSPTSVLGRMAKWLERLTYRSAEAVVALSPGMRDFVLAEGTPAEKVTVIPNCADVDLFHPGPKDRRLEARYGLEGKIVVGYAGAIGPSNAIHVVAEAARLLKVRGRVDISLVLVGDGKCKPQIEQIKEDEGLNNLVLIGSVPKHEMAELLRTCDILLVHLAKVPVLYTGSPNKLFDALATGRPVIVNSPGWTKPLVAENDVGLFVEPEDATMLADTIERLADDAEGRRRMGANARRLAETEFSRDTQADRLIELLQKVADRTGDA